MYDLPGPTGESNQYSIVPRQQILSITDQKNALLQHIATIFALGSTPVILQDHPALPGLLQKFSPALKQALKIITSIQDDAFDAVLYQGDTSALLQLQQHIAQRQGAKVGITLTHPNQAISLDRLMIERAVSINTTAAGGNASLMTMES